MVQTAKHVVFRGHVQGVGFRFTAERIARQYNVTGFVRNLPDGTVEMLVQGSAQDVESYVADVRDTFSDHIRETRITEAPYNSRYEAFGITF